MYSIEFSARAERDIRRIQPGPQRKRLREMIEVLADPPVNLDIKAIAGHSPWRRLRVGDFRVLYRPVGSELLLVERIVDRRELERAISSL